MLTVNVCAEMLATPSTSSPVSKPVDKACTWTPTWLWAGQYPSGVHCTTLLSTQVNRPVMWLGAVILIARSAAARSLTGPVNVTITGWATPTTAPLAGWIAATLSVGFLGAIAAMPGAPDPAMASTAVAAASHTNRIALPTVSLLRRDASTRHLHAVSLMCTLSGAQQTDYKMRKSGLAEQSIHHLAWAAA